MIATANVAIKLKERLDFVELRESDKRSLAALEPTINASRDGALNAFYLKATAHPETTKFFSSDPHVAHAKGRRVKPWEAISSAKFDTNYLEAIPMAGVFHARLDLEPRWYIGGYALMLDGIIRAIVAEELKGFMVRGRAKKLADDISVVVKPALLDVDAISVHLEVLAEERTIAEDARPALKPDQDAAMAALLACLVKLSNGDLTATLNASLAPGFEITVLIGNLSGDVYRSVAMVNTTGCVLKDIGYQVRTINDFMTQIASSSHEQAAGIAEINSAVTSLDQITQQNAAMAEESSASTQMLSSEAVSFADLIAGFKIQSEMSARVAAARSRPALSPARAIDASGWGPDARLGKLERILTSPPPDWKQGD